MKLSFEGLQYKLLGAFFATFGTLTALAQEEGGGGSTVTVKKTTTTHSSTVTDDWYTEPWVLIVGAALFILLLVAIIAGGRSRSTAGRTDVQKTTITRTDYRGTDA
jgi:hypothetical protein